jgi:hypothetical protein
MHPSSADMVRGAGNGIYSRRKMRFTPTDHRLIPKKSICSLETVKVFGRQSPIELRAVHSKRVFFDVIEQDAATWIGRLLRATAQNNRAPFRLPRPVKRERTGVIDVHDDVAQV